MDKVQRVGARGRALVERAQQVLVGGVNSPVRAFRGVGGHPLVLERASGPRIWDVDGNEYVDFVGSWGAMILGHAHPEVTRAIQEQAARGTSYGITSELEIELGDRVQRAMPSLEKVRFVSSGTEATMSAIRVARAFTRREKILKFTGCYHGHADSFLSQAGSGLATLGIASSPGVPECVAQLTLNSPYNDLGAVEAIFAEQGKEIAAVIVEPVAANMGVVPPVAGFLSGLRDITRQADALLIFDEVITGFRLGRGGAQEVFNVRPDLSTLGKIIGGGLPVGAYGGRREIMEMVAPEGPVYQAGTLSGNAVAMRAGIETLRQLEAPGCYEQLESKTASFVAGLQSVLHDAGVQARVNSCGSLLTVFFGVDRVSDYDTARRADTRRFAAFFGEMRNRGILLPPSQFEAWFVSAAHTHDDLEQAIAAARASLQALAADGRTPPGGIAR